MTKISQQIARGEICSSRQRAPIKKEKGANIILSDEKQNFHFISNNKQY